MASLPFVKAHGAGNDFLIVERSAIESLGIPTSRFAELAEHICSRHFGIGADGLEIVGASAIPAACASAHLWNSDGSEAEISGNGTRCVAAYLVARRAMSRSFSIETGAGLRSVESIRCSYPDFEFRMKGDAGTCRVVDGSLMLEAAGSKHRATTVDVGNPQCVCRVATFAFDWKALGAAIERHPHFPHGSNVSFVRVQPGDEGLPRLEVRFWERGAGATLSSGTGSLGAAVAARHHGWVGCRVTIGTQGGDLIVDWEDGIGLTGPARIVAKGRYEVDLAGTR